MYCTVLCCNYLPGRARGSMNVVARESDDRRPASYLRCFFFPGIGFDWMVEEKDTQANSLTLPQQQQL